jgi:hypothetical protein
MAVLSLGMCACCERLGELLGLPPSVVGITFSAVGTSLPNLIASMVAANQARGRRRPNRFSSFGNTTWYRTCQRTRRERPLQATARVARESD